jgi:hypothetical protein
MKKYFMIMELLERRKEKGKAEIEMKKKHTASEETEITVEEVEREMRKLIKRKAPGRDGMQNEAWMSKTEGNSGVPGERECKRKKNDDEI